jgi:NAD(P)-dependent dehydrogenase (short-subunit alcohol dehydrogenase family)
MTEFSGGAQGIGAEAVEIFVNAGANVVFADLNVTGGKPVEAKLNGYLTLLSLLKVGRKTNFHECDGFWPSLLKLFKFTYEKHGRNDVVAANAGIHGHERWLEDLASALHRNPTRHRHHPRKNL